MDKNPVFTDDARRRRYDYNHRRMFIVDERLNKFEVRNDTPRTVPYSNTRRRLFKI